MSEITRERMLLDAAATCDARVTLTCSCGYVATMPLPLGIGQVGAVTRLMEAHVADLHPEAREAKHDAVARRHESCPHSPPHNAGPGDAWWCKGCDRWERVPTVGG